MASPNDVECTRPAKRTKFDFIQDFAVLVGKDETRFVIHKNVVCSRSDFFRAACEGGWQESREKVVRLPEVEPSIFTIYLGWLYTVEVDMSNEEEGGRIRKYTKGMTREQRDHVTASLIDAYVLGDMLQDKRFRNAVIDDTILFVEGVKELLGDPEVFQLWTKVPHESPLMRLWVGYFAAVCSLTAFDDVASLLPAGFVMKIARAGIRDKRMTFDKRHPQYRAKCFYHDHEDESDKCL